MSYKSTTYTEDSDADDEYERSVITSPTLPQSDYETSPTDSDPPSAEHTPTTFTHSGGSGSHVSPKGLMTQWTAEQCADFVSSLGLSQYSDAFLGMLAMRSLIHVLANGQQRRKSQAMH